MAPFALMLTLALVPAQSGAKDIQVRTGHQQVKVGGKSYQWVKPGKPMRLQVQRDAGEQLTLDVVRIGDAARKKGKARISVRVGRREQKLDVRAALEDTLSMPGGKLASYPVRHRVDLPFKANAVRITVVSGGDGVGVRVFTKKQKKSRLSLASIGLEKKKKKGKRSKKKKRKRRKRRVAKTTSNTPVDDKAAATATDDAKSTDDKATDDKATDDKATDDKATDDKAETTAADAKSTDDKTTDDKTTEDKTTPPADGDKTADDKAAADKTTDDKTDAAEASATSQPSDGAVSNDSNANPNDEVDVVEVKPERPADDQPADGTRAPTDLRPLHATDDVLRLHLQAGGGGWSTSGISPLTATLSARAAVTWTGPQKWGHNDGDGFYSRTAVGIGFDIGVTGAFGTVGGQASTWTTWMAKLRLEAEYLPLHTHDTERLLGAMGVDLPVGLEAGVLAGVGVAFGNHAVVVGNLQKTANPFVGPTIRVGPQVGVLLGPGRLTVGLPIDVTVPVDLGGDISFHLPIEGGVLVGYRLSL